MFHDVRDIYRQSRKQKDIFWNTHVARPVAAVVISLLGPSRVTPNQVTFVSLSVAVLAAAVLVVWRSYAGLVVGALVLELSYVLDCVDGQLARLRGQSTPVGAHLDFLMDELKAFLYMSAVTLRLWLAGGRTHYLVVGLLGLAAVAAAISLTTFMRRQEYLATAPSDEGTPPAASPSPVARLVAVVESGGRFVVHYPSYFLYLAVADLLAVFFYAYISAHVLYLGRSLLSVVWRLGRSTGRAEDAPREIAG